MCFYDIIKSIDTNITTLLKMRQNLENISQYIIGGSSGLTKQSALNIINKISDFWW